MTEDRDPVQEAGGDGVDLYDVATWEERTFLDRASTKLYGSVVTAARATVVALAVLIVFAQFAAATGLVLVNRPVVAVYVLLSVAPALGLAGYIWRADVTRREPIQLLVVTFALGFLFAGFAAVLNSAFSGLFFSVVGGSSAWVAVLAPVLFFFLVVGPVEETVKWLAVRLYAYRSGEFDAVVDGAVYGAMAGLGFATIENAIYVSREVLAASQSTGVAVGDIAVQTAAVRTLAGPGHVIYSAFAGYYLGLAKFNPENRGPIVVKGLLIAALVHATYNTAVTNLGVVTDTVGLAPGAVFIAFVVVYDGAFFYVLYRKLQRYRNAYVETGASEVYDDEDQLDDAETGRGSASEDTRSQTGTDSDYSVADAPSAVDDQPDVSPESDESPDADASPDADPSPDADER